VTPAYRVQYPATVDLVATRGQLEGKRLATSYVTMRDQSPGHREHAHVSRLQSPTGNGRRSTAKYDHSRQSPPRRDWSMRWRYRVDVPSATATGDRRPGDDPDHGDPKPHGHHSGLRTLGQIITPRSAESK
jgi:hypothetical protein